MTKKKKEKKVSEEIIDVKAEAPAEEPKADEVAEEQPVKEEVVEEQPQESLVDSFKEKISEAVDNYVAAQEMVDDVAEEILNMTTRSDAVNELTEGLAIIFDTSIVRIRPHAILLNQWMKENHHKMAIVICAYGPDKIAGHVEGLQVARKELSRLDSILRTMEIKFRKNLADISTEELEEKLA